LIYLLKMEIVHSYVNLPDAIFYPKVIEIDSLTDPLGGAGRNPF
jgi:hypothetical protein